MSESGDAIEQWAESFGPEAERYDRARPRYPSALVEGIVAASPGIDVLDVGCGTGIADRQLRAAGARVLGVEIDGRMAGLARRSGLEVEVAPFEAWDAAGRSFDAVVSGQAWHWIEPVAGAAKAAEVLRPSGLLAPFWNLGQPPPEVAEAFSAVNRRVLSGPLATMWERPALEAYAGVLARVTEGIRSVGAFDEPEQWRFEWESSYTRDDWLDQLPTFGGHAQLPAARLEALLAGIGAAVDAVGGSFTMCYTTVAVATTRKG